MIIKETFPKLDTKSLSDLDLNNLYDFFLSLLDEKELILMNSKYNKVDFIFRFRQFLMQKLQEAINLDNWFKR